nr:alginate lyase family protein [uncultured Desulfobacter sp.]
MPVREYVSRVFRVLIDLKAYILLSINVFPNPLIQKRDVDSSNDRPRFFADGADIRQILPLAYKEECLKEADLCLNHQVSFFELENYNLGSAIRWNFDYKNNIETPIRYAGFKDFRSFKHSCDVKYVFELNKHQELPRLAQAYLINSDSRYVEELLLRIQTWLEQCPFMKGVNWSSPTVSAYRLTSWTTAYELLSGKDLFPEVFFEKWCKSIFQHIYFVSKNYSLFSSAGNHLISEATGVFVACLRWKFFFTGKDFEFLEKSEKKAFSILCESMALQFFEDGVNCEQAASYQLFATQQMFFAYWMGQQSGYSFPQKFSKILLKSGEFLADILNKQDQLPNYGDEDGAWAFRLSNQNSNRFKDQIDLCSVLFDIPLIVHGKNSDIAETAYWIFGAKAVEMARILKNTPKGNQNNSLREQFYPDGGYYVTASNSRSDKESLFFMDAGPLGIPSTGGHGHSDALSFCLSIGGIWVFVDSGTNVYKDTLDRKRLRSTSAHNTLSFGEDNSQDEYLGPFLWGKRHVANGELIEPGLFQGEVKWFSGEIHKREIRIDSGLIMINDHWQGRRAPAISLHVNPELKETIHKIKEGSVFIETDSFLLQVVCEREIILDRTFVSPSFYKLEEAIKLVISPEEKQGHNTIEIKWEFK